MLRTHDFVEQTNGEAGAFRIFHCRSCARRFKFDKETHATFAIESDAAYTVISSAVGDRWLNERCPGGTTAGKR